MIAITEIGTNLQTAIVAVGVAWAIAFIIYVIVRHGLE